MNSSTTPPPDADSPFLVEPTEEVPRPGQALGSTASTSAVMSRFITVVLACSLVVAAIGVTVFISIDEPSPAFEEKAEQPQRSTVREFEPDQVESPTAGFSNAGPPTTAAPPPPTEAPSTSTMQSPATTVLAPVTTTVGGYPAVAADLIEVREDKGTKIYVLDNDGSGDSPFDLDSLQIVTAPSHAKEYEIDDGHIRYKSTKDFEGTDSLEYLICNTNDLCTTGIVTISVVPKK